MGIYKRLTNMGIEYKRATRGTLPFPPASRIGRTVHTSGQVSSARDNIGKVGQEVHPETAAQAAADATLNGLQAIDYIAPLDAIKKIAHLKVLVNVAPGFTDTTKIGNGATDFLHHALGPKKGATHSRIASGAASLPLDSSVEITMIAELKHFWRIRQALPIVKRGLTNIRESLAARSSKRNPNIPAEHPQRAHGASSARPTDNRGKEPKR